MLRSRSDLAVSHGLAGFLRRLPGFSPGFPPPFSVAEDSRACCIPLPIVGFDAFVRLAGCCRPRSRGHRWSPPLPVTTLSRRKRRKRAPSVWPMVSGDVPRIELRTPRRIPPSRSRTVSPRPLPSRTPQPTRSRPSRRLRCQKRRCCRTVPELSLRALLRGRVRTASHPVRMRDGLPSLGLVPLRGRLHVPGPSSRRSGVGDPTGPGPRPALPRVPRSRSVAFAFVPTVVALRLLAGG